MKEIWLPYLILILIVVVDSKKVIVILNAPPLVDTQGFSRSWLKPRDNSNRFSEHLSIVAKRTASRTLLEQQQEDFLSQLEAFNKKRSINENQFILGSIQTESGVVESRFSVLLNALIVDIGESTNEKQAMNVLKTFPHVRSVEMEQLFEPNLFASLDQTKVHSAWNTIISSSPSSVNTKNTTTIGKGIKIALMDSGLWVGADMFSGSEMSFPTDIPSPGLGETTNTNAKVLVSRVYLNPSYTYSSDETHSWPYESSGCHGMHTGLLDFCFLKSIIFKFVLFITSCDFNYIQKFLSLSI